MIRDHHLIKSPDRKFEKTAYIALTYDKIKTRMLKGGDRALEAIVDDILKLSPVNKP